jgi:hypothetical protein
MTTLLLKLLLTPLLIGAVSLAGRRWGPAIGGLLVGLPLTSGPVALFLALDQGTGFAASASVGILAGGVSVAAFCLAYSWLAVRRDWRLTLATSWLVFLLATGVLQELQAPLMPLYAATIVVLVAALLLLPHGSGVSAGATLPWWDLPARMLAATGSVVLLTELAPAFGPRLSGLLAPFPIFASILAAFTHALQGPAAAARLLRGVVLGLFAFTTFFLVLGLLLVPAGIAAAFFAAIGVTLALQGVSLWLLRRQDSRV